MSTTAIQDLPAQYDHTAAQKKWYAHWESKGYFHADVDSKKPPFSVVIPPPNVTGALHLGHALNNTLQDILCRRKRMQGYNVLWMPGTDHAGIATQAVVERRLLEEEGKSRHDLGREGLIDRIWEWKAQYEKRITGQLKQLGASCDWKRQRFTLDDQCARAVRETFFELFDDGKVYRGKRLVNWDTFLQTAVSDDEVFHEEVKGFFWSFHYPVVDPQTGEPTRVTIATTRPETMLGDTAVAVHPNPAKQLDKVEAELKEKLAAANEKDKPAIEAQIEALVERRKTHLPTLETLRDMANRGVLLELPLTDRKIPLITDEWAKPELGSGCVKITPAHDQNDYEVYGRNESIGAINILNADGTLADNVPEKYRGLTMKQARKAVIADLEEAKCHDPEADVEDRIIELAHSDRSKTPIEPYLADQWFIRMDELAQSAMDAVNDGSVTITPTRYSKSYIDWLSEKRDWPVGRQLWWGHRIPVWTATIVEDATAEAQEGDDYKAYASSAVEELKAFLVAAGYSKKDISFESISEFELQVCTSKVEIDKLFESLIKWRNKQGPKLVTPGKPNLPAPNFLDGYEGNEAVTLAAFKINHVFDIQQSEEVLDTWFSSALWPFSTMGWPEQTKELDVFYPTATLVTSRDIITLWVARMVLMGIFNLDEIPFPEVYIHPKILDGFGETMSKSKGNGVDPLDVIDQFGADSLRFGIAYLTTETQDVRMPVEFVCPGCRANIKQTKKNRVLHRIECPECNEAFRTQWAESEEDLALPRGAVTSERFELGRNFCNKLWNASRFALTNLEGYEPGNVNAADLRVEDRWLLSRLASLTSEVSTALDEYRFADAARALYEFAWNEFCSFYVEITKARFAEEGADKQVAQRLLAHALDTLLRLLHPMTPFLTEEVWQLLATVAPQRGLTDPEPAGESICIASWPESDASHIDQQIEDQFAKFQAVLGTVREARQGQSIPNRESVEFSVQCDDATAELLKPMQSYFTQMTRATMTTIGPKAEVPSIAASKPIGGFGSPIEVHVDVAQFIDVEAEKARLSKEEANLSKFIKGMESKLSNEKFVSNAPVEVVEQQRAKLAETKGQLESIKAALAKLG